MLLYWLCVSRRSTTSGAAPPGCSSGILSAWASSSPESADSLSIQDLRAASSGATGFDPQPSGMRNAHGGLLQQQRFFRMIAVDQPDQGLAECFDLIGGGVRLRKMQPCRRRDTVIVVACGASSFLQDRVQPADEGVCLPERNGPRKEQQANQYPHGWSIPQISCEFSRSASLRLATCYLRYTCLRGSGTHDGSV